MLDGYNVSLLQGKYLQHFQSLSRSLPRIDITLVLCLVPAVVYCVSLSGHLCVIARHVEQREADVHVQGCDNTEPNPTVMVTLACCRVYHKLSYFTIFPRLHSINSV